MNLANTVFLTITGVGATPEDAGTNFGAAFNNAIAAEPGLATREYGDAFTTMSPMIAAYNPDGSFGGYQLHARVAFDRQPSDPANGWEFTVIPTV